MGTLNTDGRMDLYLNSAKVSIRSIDIERK